jgi:peptide/nickel transport system substrate-binding protein
MMQALRVIRRTACIILVIFCAASCGSVTGGRSDDAGVKVVRVATHSDEGTLTPYSYVTGDPGWSMLTLVFDTLFIINTDNEPRPWLAVRHDVSEDGRTHTLTLRPDATWHDGRPVTSADIKFAFEYYRDHYYGRWTRAVREIVGIGAPDSTTVVVTLRQPDPAFVRKVLADVPIIPKHVWEHVTEPKKIGITVGSGPYRLAAYEPNQYYRFTAHPTHFAGPPAVDELLMPVIVEPSTAFAALESGQIDATTRDLAPELVRQFESKASLKFARGPGFAATLLQFNTERPPWSDAVVRRAIGMAIDTQKLVDVLLLGHGTAGNPGWLHPTSPMHDPALVPHVDVARANALLDGAGYRDRDGDGIREANGRPMRPVLLVQANQPLRVRAAELIAQAVAAIGIRVEVRPEESTSLTAKVWPDFDVAKGRNFDWTMFGWSAPVLADPLRITAIVDSDTRYGINNIGGFRHPEADAIATRLRSAIDEAEQQRLIRQLEGVIARERPFVVLWYADLVNPYNHAAYGSWRFQKGHGIFHKLSFLPNVNP